MRNHFERKRRWRQLNSAYKIEQGQFLQVADSLSTRFHMSTSRENNLPTWIIRIGNFNKPCRVFKTCCSLQSETLFSLTILDFGWLLRIDDFILPKKYMINASLRRNFSNCLYWVVSCWKVDSPARSIKCSIGKDIKKDDSSSSFKRIQLSDSRNWKSTTM